jgi:hypothetical protein
MAPGANFVWIIDPLDGTTNFVMASPCTASASRWPCAARSNNRGLTDRNDTCLRHQGRSAIT